MTITFYKQSKTSLMYYTMHDRQGNLFTPYTFTSVWGSVIESGRQRVFTFNSREEMNKKLRFLMGKRIKSGYKVLYSFSRNKTYTEIFDYIKDLQVG